MKGDRKMKEMVKLEIPKWLADEKRISFGQCHGNNIIVVFEKVRETEKAICINDDMTGEIWLPKSQIQILPLGKKEEENDGYGKYGFELIDENDREWVIVIRDSKKVREIEERMNFPYKGKPTRVSCSIYENENTAVLLFNNVSNACYKMSIEELLEKIS